VDRNVLVSGTTSDDAGVVLLAPDLALVLTTDFFTPMVDDPFDFGRIAAANALSDVYAMGATPFSALNITGFPPRGIEPSVLTEILRGGQKVAREAGIEIVGGHTVKTSEPLYGLAVVGTVHPDRIVTNAGARPGDRLILTKPIGSALVTTAFKNDKDRFGAIHEAVRWMATLNRAGAEAMLAAGARAATDITGFGLLGHLVNILEASGVSAEIEASRVPLLPGALEYAREGLVCGGSVANRKQAESLVSWSDSVEDAMRTVLCDAQTSGGLLIAIAPEREDALLRDLASRGIPEARSIGRIVEKMEPLVRVL
jgi:selenide,water dikinase